MGTINQPKPSEPKSPSADRHPLSPGTVESGVNYTPAARTTAEAPERLKDQFDEVERHKK